MKYAKAMYLGGDIVKAEECDYKSYKKLGIKCPYCNEALFLCKGKKRKAYFSHYEGKKEECELRIKINKNKNIIERIKIESKGQRLKLYNKHLWDLMNKDKNKDVYISRETEIRVKRIIIKGLKNGKEEFNKLVKRIRNYWKDIEEEEEYSEYLKYFIEGYEKSNNIFKEKESEKSKEKINKLKKIYKTEIEIKWHIKICKEIEEYLRASRSNYIWEKFTIKALVYLFDSYKYINYKNMRDMINKIDEDYIEIVIKGTIVSTLWREKINKYL